MSVPHCEFVKFGNMNKLIIIVLMTVSKLSIMLFILIKYPSAKTKILSEYLMKLGFQLRAKSLLGQKEI